MYLRELSAMVGHFIAEGCMHHGDTLLSPLLHSPVGSEDRSSRRRKLLVPVSCGPRVNLTSRQGSARVIPNGTPSLKASIADEYIVSGQRSISFHCCLFFSPSGIIIPKLVLRVPSLSIDLAVLLPYIAMRRVRR